MEGYQAYNLLRIKTGLSMLDFAREVGIAYGSEYNYETGKRPLTNMNVDAAVRIFSYFHKDMEKFFFKYYPEIKEEVDEQIRKRGNWYKRSKMKYHYTREHKDRHPSVDRIYALLHESDLRMMDLAEIAQVSKQSIYMCRNDAIYSSMHIGTALKICYVFNKSFSDIFYP